MNSMSSYLEESIQKCTLCSLYGHSTNKEFGKMYGFGYSGKYLILGSNPSNRRISSGGYAMSENEVSGNNSEDYLWKCLKEINWPIKSSYFTNIAKCSTPNNRPLFSTEFEMCGKTWLAQEIMIVSPRVIVCLGNDAYNSFEKVNFWFSEYLKIYKIFHHAYISRVPEKYGEWKDQWVKILLNS